MAPSHSPLERQSAPLSPFETADSGLSLVVTEGELQRDPRAYHGRRITVRALLSRGFEHSTLSIAWCELPEGESESDWDGLHLVEATGVWHCDGKTSYGHLGAWDAEFRVSRIALRTPSAERTIIREELLDLVPDEVTVVRICTEVELGDDRWNVWLGNRRIIESGLGRFPFGAPWKRGRRVADLVLVVTPSNKLYVVSATWIASPGSARTRIKVVGSHELDRELPGAARVIGQLVSEAGQVFLEGGPVNGRRLIEVSEEIEERLAHGPAMCIVSMDRDEVLDVELVEATLEETEEQGTLRLADVFEDQLGFIIEEYELPGSARRVLVRVAEEDASGARLGRWERGGFAGLQAAQRELRRAARAWAEVHAHERRAEQLRAESERIGLPEQRHQVASLAFKELLFAERARLRFAAERTRFGRSVRRAADARRMNG